MSSPQVECPRCGLRRYVRADRTGNLCEDCRYIGSIPTDAHALPDGEWVNNKGVRRYMPTPPAPEVKKVLSACGTTSGYAKHLRNGETACMECKNASRDYARARRGIEAIQKLKPHGTHAAYMRHYSAQTRPCDACVDAEREYQREAKKRRRAELRAEKKVA